MTEVDIIKWHQDNGGHVNNPRSLAHHSLRLLRETVELCIAAGADWHEVQGAVEREAIKARERGEWGGNPDDLPQEFADISFLQEVFAYYAEIHVSSARAEKFRILLGREWEVDQYGVLWRPGTKALL